MSRGYEGNRTEVDKMNDEVNKMEPDENRFDYSYNTCWLWSQLL
ncbi:hypothetical protein [Pontibacter harenae]|nr:hypothetical protein [Pontibacter harenae]